MLATERGALSLGGAAAGSGRGDLDDLGSTSAAGSKLGSLDGEIDVLLAGGALEIQAGEQLRTYRADVEGIDTPAGGFTLSVGRHSTLPSEACTGELLTAPLAA